MISIIIPALDEAGTIQATLERLQIYRQRGHEVLLVDGGSRDETVALANPLVDRLVHSRAGRATQMNRGAREARGDLLWFLHADTLVGTEMDNLFLSALDNSRQSWGRFDVRLSGGSPLLRLIGEAMNLRSRLSGIATGDQGIFVRRDTFERAGGFAPIPLMEDVELSRRLKHTVGRPLCLRQKLVTSSRRWESRGILRTILLMWRLRLAFFFGADPARLARHYR